MKNFTNEKNIIAVVTAMTAAGADTAQIEAVVKSLMTNNGIITANNGATVIIGNNNKINAGVKKSTKKNHRGSRGKKHSSQNTEVSVVEEVKAAEKAVETTTIDSKHVMLSGAKYFLQDKKEKVYVGARISFPKKDENAKVTFVIRTKESMSTHEYEVNVDERGERKFIASVPLFVLLENAKELGLENKAVLVDIISAETPERLSKLYALAKDAKVSIYGSICVTKSEDTPEIIKIKGLLDSLRNEAKNANKGNASVSVQSPEKDKVKDQETVTTEEPNVETEEKVAKTTAVEEMSPWKMDWKSVGFSVEAED